MRRGRILLGQGFGPGVVVGGTVVVQSRKWRSDDEIVVKKD